MSKTVRVYRGTFVTAAAIAVSSLLLPPTTEAGGIVSSIVKAPIVPDGDVAGSPTDVVVNLDGSLDPSVPGRALLAGRSIRITLPDGFLDLGNSIGLPATCPAPDPCNTGVLLQGWPQNPIPPIPANYALSIEDPNTIVFTAARDLIPGDPTLNGPGIKQMHLILKGFVNPRPGVQWVRVESETGPGGSLETGVGSLHIVPRPRASINVTSVFAGARPFANTIFQQTDPGQSIPIPWNFLVWDKRGQPAVGVEIRQVNGGHAQLVNGRRVVGQIFIDAPGGARGQSISGGPSTLVNAPVLGAPTGRLTVDFVAGNTPGTYVITLQMNKGNSVDMQVDVN